MIHFLEFPPQTTKIPPLRPPIAFLPKAFKMENTKKKKISYAFPPQTSFLFSSNPDRRQREFPFTELNMTMYFTYCFIQSLEFTLCVFCINKILSIQSCSEKYIFTLLTLSRIYGEHLKRKRGFYIRGFPLSWNKILKPKVQKIFNFAMSSQTKRWTNKWHTNWWILLCAFESDY